MLSEDVRKEWTRKLEWGWSLSSAPEDVCDDRELVMIAVKNNGRNIEFASKRLQEDIDVVEAAITQDAMALYSVDKDLQEKIIDVGTKLCRMVLLYSYSISYLSDDGFRDVSKYFLGTDLIECDLADVNAYFSIKFCKPLLREPWLYKYKLSKDVRKEWTKKLKSGWSLSFAPEEVRSNKKMVMIAVQKNGMNLKFTTESLKGNIDVVEAAITQDVRALQFVDEYLKQKIISFGIIFCRELHSYEGTELPEGQKKAYFKALAESLFESFNDRSRNEFGKIDNVSEPSKQKQLVKKPTK